MTRKWIVWYLTCLMLVIAVAPRAEAAFAPSGALAVSSDGRAEDLARIQAVLEMKVVKAHLSSLGFTPSEIAERLSGLTAERLHALATSLDEAKTGGTGEGVLIGVAIIVLVILVILPLMGIRVWR